MPLTTSLLIIAVLLQHAPVVLGNAGPGSVDLGAAKDFVILAKDAITTVPKSSVTGNIGLFPSTSTSMKGFELIKDASNQFAWIGEEGEEEDNKFYARDYTISEAESPLLSTAISDMAAAYEVASNRNCENTDPSGPPTCTVYNEHLGGSLGPVGGVPVSLAPGLYKWTNAVTISDHVTLHGSATDTWIFHSAGAVTLAAQKSIILTGGALAENIVWVMAGALTVLEGAHLQGTVIVGTAATFTTEASLTGRLLATTVSLHANTITQPPITQS
jgi:hypothetical protein